MLYLSVLISAFLLQYGAKETDINVGSNWVTSFTVEELEPFIADRWLGTVTEFDTGNPELVTQAVKIGVSETSRGITLNFEYPDTMQANEELDLSISEDGSLLGVQKLTSKSFDGIFLTVMTNAKCKDRNQNAHCEYKYEVTDQTLSITKAVFLENNTVRGYVYNLKRQ